MFDEDSSYYLLCSLENIDEDGRLESKADMFTKRTIRPERHITSVDTFTWTAFRSRHGVSKVSSMNCWI